MDLKEFRKANGLTQDDLGEYLGLKKSFISEIERGGRSLPSRHFRSLIDNDRGWDVSALTPPRPSVSAVAMNRSGVNVEINSSIEVAVLRKEVEMLRIQNEELKDMVKILANALENAKNKQYGKE